MTSLMQVKKLPVYYSFLKLSWFFSIWRVWIFSFWFWISRFLSWAFMMSQRGRESSDESSASSPLFPIPISRFHEINVTKSTMFTLMSDPFTFMATLIGCWGSLHTVPYEPHQYWREPIVIFMAIFGIVWKFRLEIFFKKVKKVKNVKKAYKKNLAKKVYAQKFYAKKTYGKKPYSTKSYAKPRKGKVTFQVWIGEWFGLWIGLWIKGTIHSEVIYFYLVAVRYTSNKKFKKKKFK